MLGMREHGEYMMKNANNRRHVKGGVNTLGAMLAANPPLQ